MKFMLTIAVLTLAFSNLAVAQDSDHGSARWFADYDKALAVAKEEGKDLLVDFTGSDWCGWCIRLKKEVFSHAEFFEPAGEKYVFVALDYPRSEEAKAAVPNPARNQALQNKHAISGFPTVLLMTSDEVVYARTGYQQGGPEAYMKSIEDFRSKDRVAVLETLAFVQTEADGEEAQAAHAAKALDMLTAGGSSEVVTKLLAPVVEKALVGGRYADVATRTRAVTALVGAGHMTDGVKTLVLEIDAKNEMGLREKLLAASFDVVRDDSTALAALKALDDFSTLTFKDSGLRERLVFNAMRWTSGPLADQERSKKYAKVVLEISSNDRMKDAAKKILGKE